MRHAADAIDSPAMRQAGRELLSLALMDARNHTLHLLACYEPVRPDAVLSVADAIAQHAARWTAPQAADAAFPSRSLAEARERLLVQFEATLEALDAAPDDDAGLAAFRAALFHEDAWGEELVVEAQALGLALPLAVPAAIAPREPRPLPATRWTLGSPATGFAFPLERPAHDIDVPDFEIDAQPVTWAQYVEFVDDGGYDREELWHPAGWAWLQDAALSQDRRGPRHVEQIGVASGAVTQVLFGRAARRSGAQPAMHVTGWEADAWARWAGRRLPTEVEWEVAAHQAARRGFRWGEVLEWTAGTLRPWSGYQPEAWIAGTLFDPEGAWGHARVLRGASFVARSRMRHPRSRAFAWPSQDESFTGFRTCAS